MRSKRTLNPQLLALLALAWAMPISQVFATGSNSSLITITFSPPVPVTGQPFNLVATVISGSGSGPTPTGTVNFVSSSIFPPETVSLGTGGGASNQAITLVSNGLPGGSNPITATYNGDSTYAGSTIVASINISPVPLNITVSLPTPGPYMAGDNILAAVTVTGQSPGSAIGSFATPVTLYINGIPQGQTYLGSLGGGVYAGSFDGRFIQGGPQTISTYYNADSNYQTSLSPNLVVNSNPTTVQMTFAINRTSPVYGESTTMSWGVFLQNTNFSIPYTPTGSVSFFDGGVPLGATLAVSQNPGQSLGVMTENLLAGVHSLVVSYSGDTNFQGQSVTVSKTVTQAPTGTSDGFNSDTAYGVPVSLTAYVLSPNIYGPVSWSGPVSFFDSLDGYLGTQNLAFAAFGVTLVTSSLSIGSHSVTAVYGGDDNYLPSTSTYIYPPFNISKADVGVGVTVSAGPYYYGETVNFGASVSATGSSGVPSGSVTFYDGGVTLGSAALSAGDATFNTRFLTLGSQSVTVSYPGDGNFTGPSSATTLLNVLQEPTTVSLTSGFNPSVSGIPITLTASVGPADAAYLSLSVPSGVVTFVDNTTSSILGTAFLSDGTAVLPVNLAATGAHSIAAYYQGAPDFTAGNSAAWAQTVIAPTPTATPVYNRSPLGQLSLGPNIAGDGQPICLFLDKPILDCQWDIYNIAGERVAHLYFNSQKACWDHAGIASGFYLIRIQADYQDGTAFDKTFKAVIRH